MREKGQRREGDVGKGRGDGGKNKVKRVGHEQVNMVVPWGGGGGGGGAAYPDISTVVTTPTIQSKPSKEDIFAWAELDSLHG